MLSHSRVDLALRRWGKLMVLENAGNRIGIILLPLDYSWQSLSAAAANVASFFAKQSLINLCG